MPPDGRAAGGRLAALVMLLLAAAGCTTGVIVHDQTRAAELVVDFLSSLKSDQGRKLAYAWTADEYQRDVSFAEFAQIVASLRASNRGADIRLVGFEVFGAKEEMVVYADTVGHEDGLHFRFSLFGSKTRDYFLLDFSASSKAFSKKGIYRAYRQPITVQGI